MRAQAGHKRHRPDKRTSHEHHRPSHRAPKASHTVPNRPRRRQIAPEGAKPSHTAPNRPPRLHIGPEGAKAPHKAPPKRRREQTQTSHSPATRPTRSPSKGRGYASDTRKQTSKHEKNHEKPHKNPEDFLRKWHRFHESNSLGKPLPRPCENNEEVPMKTICMTQIFNSVPIWKNPV
jgi:hypothetical protein